MVEKYSGVSYEPVFTILSKQAVVRQPKTPENLFSLFTLLVTLFTTFLYSVDTFRYSFVKTYLLNISYFKHMPIIINFLSFNHSIFNNVFIFINIRVYILFSLNPDFAAKAIAGDETVLNQLVPVFVSLIHATTFTF